MGTFAFYSAGGFARETHEGFALSASMMGSDAFDVVFIDDDEDSQGVRIHGKRVISYEEAKTLTDIRVNVAFAHPGLRKEKVGQCENDGIKFFSSTAPSVVLGPNVIYGPGAIFSHNSTVTSDARIGKAFHCNIYSYVAHDCVIGDFVTLAPRVSLNGRIKIEDDVYVGSDATFLPGKPGRFLTIGKGAIIGAGALVTKDVEPYTTVVGSPARPVKQPPQTS